MSKLKKSLLEKTEMELSKNFDQVFFQKLEKERARPRVFATWITWLISGCATASVLFIALNTNNIQPHKFNHQEYVDSAMEFQSSFNEGITDDKTVDLTTFSSDEI